RHLPVGDAGALRRLGRFQVSALPAVGEVRGGRLARPQNPARLLRLPRRKARAHALAAAPPLERPTGQPYSPREAAPPLERSGRRVLRCNSIFPAAIRSAMLSFNAREATRVVAHRKRPAALPLCRGRVDWGDRPRTGRPCPGLERNPRLTWVTRAWGRGGHARVRRGGGLAGQRRPRGRGRSAPAWGW